MKEKEFLLEIGTEEIPAAALDAAVADLKSICKESLESNRILHGGIKAFGTPRRLVLYIESMVEAQEDRMIEKRGPSKNAAYDESGNFTKAAIGFAKGLGVDVSDIKIIETEKGEYIGVSKKLSGEKTINVLSEILPEVILNIPFKKSMRWSDGTIRFSRPIHWILALFGDEVVRFSIGDFSKGSIESSDLSYGHRFLSPSEFKIKDFKQYKKELEKRSVIIDSEERKDIIRNDIKNIETSSGFKVVEDDELLDHVANLVEFPVTVRGNFDERFLELPEEVLKTSMKEHQKYFAMTYEGGKLANAFINVLNTKPVDENVVIKGNERVLRARLSDAEFFYDEDKKKKLDEYNERLKGVVFHKKLGSMHEKVERIEANAKFIADTLAPDITEKAARAASLCKADLVTQMVVEFPKLQGIMGREYAVLSGEESDVAQAVYEHYLPLSADGALPSSDIGAIVSIADKIDTIVSCFSVGLIPTGSADPFALRRQTLGILNMILDKTYSLSLDGLIRNAYANIKEKAAKSEEETVNLVLDFFKARLKNQLTSETFTYDVIDAVLALGLYDVNESYKKIESLSSFKKRSDFEALSISFKRVANIVKNEKSELGIDTSLFNHDSEKRLFEKYNEVKDIVSGHCAKDDYMSALEVATNLKAPIDKFFDDVLVMDKDEALKNNRLGLLQNIQNVFLNIADFKRIA